MSMLILDNRQHQQFRQNVKNFIENEVKPHAIEWEQRRHFPEDLLQKVGDSGFLGLSLPENIGGKGEELWHEVILAEELAKSHALGWALSVLVQGNMVAPLISELGTKEQKEEILRPALAGEFYLALAATDLSSGSDLASITTTALLENGNYVLTGEKRYITNGSIAEYVVTLARTKTDKNIWGLGLFLVPGNTKGMEKKRLDTSGLKTGDTASITFNKCVLKKDSLLGNPTRGFLYLLRGLQRERLIGAVALNSLALYVWEDTLNFLKNRNRFNEPLSKKQVIRHRMAEMRTTIEAARQFTYSVCESFAQNRPVDKEILMLKIFSYENCEMVIRECSHLQGAGSFLDDHWLSHARRDSQAFSLAAGTSEIIRDMLSGMLKM